MQAEQIFEKYKHVIWDWNGTILDDVQLCTDIINNILKRRNRPGLTIKEYKDIFTFPVINYYKAAGLDVSGDNFEIMSHEFINEYEKRKNQCPLYSGALEVIDSINKMGITQSVLSAYSQNTLEEIINHFGLAKYFIKLVGLDNIYAASKLQNGKSWIKELNINPKEVLMVGDTVHDYEVALEMGVDCILLSGGHQSFQRLSGTGTKVIKSHYDLLKHS